MKTLYRSGLAALLLCGAGCASTLQNATLDHARNDIKWHFYRFALADLSRAEDYQEPPPSKKAEITYLKGVCYDGMNRPADARAMYHFVADHFPDTEFAYQAREKLGVGNPNPKPAQAPEPPTPPAPPTPPTSPTPPTPP